MGAKIMWTKFHHTSEPLSPSGTKNIQRIVGSFLYYARAVDNAIHTVLNDIATTQASPTMKTKDATLMLMDSLYTRPNAKIRYQASNMQLYIDSNAAYLFAPKAKSRIAGYFYLNHHYTGGSRNPSPKLNAPIHIKCQLLKYVVLSTAEVETSAIFYNFKIIFRVKEIFRG